MATQHEVGPSADVLGSPGSGSDVRGRAGAPVLYGDLNAAPRPRRPPLGARRPARRQRPDPLRPAQPGPRPARLPCRPGASVPGQRGRRLARADGGRRRRAASTTGRLMRTGRPRTPIGTHGAINTRREGGRVVAETRVRDLDGRLRQVRASGSTAAAARSRLLERPSLPSAGVSSAHPFVWIKTAEQILKKANRPTPSNPRH
jgi:hypothetical protein